MEANSRSQLMSQLIPVDHQCWAAKSRARANEARGSDALPLTRSIKPIIEKVFMLMSLKSIT